MEMRNLTQRLLAATLFIAVGGGSAWASVADLRALVNTENSIEHLYTFEGATTPDRQQDKVGSANLSVASYGSGASLSYTAGFDGTTTALTPGVTPTAGQALTSSALTLNTSITVEALIAPDGSVGSATQYAVASGGSPTRGYFMLQREGDLKTGIGSGTFSDGDALRDYTAAYNAGDWYYTVGTYEISGGNTVFNSWVANLSDATPTLVKTNDNVVINGTYDTTTNLGLGVFASGTAEAFNGSIDEVAVYGTTFNDFTVQRHFSALTDTSMVIYRELFPNDTDNNQPLSTDGWQINSAAGAATTTQINSPTNGTPTDVTAVNSNPDSAETARGYLFNNDANDVDYLAWTDEYTVNREAFELTEISWYQSNESTSDISRAAIEINGQWYASDQTFQNTTTHTGAGAGELMSLDFTTATWRLLDFVDGSSLSLGSAAALPGGDISAFGVYYDSKSARLRLDTFTVSGVATAVPTPAALPAGLVLMALAIRRRSH